jgi:cyclic pyranopterin phosphate synthase
MVNIDNKASTKRSAKASGRIYIPLVAYELVTCDDNSSFAGHDSAPAVEKAKAKARSKGDVLSVAQLAGIMGCKRTSDIIPLCHPLLLSHVDVRLTPSKETMSGGVRYGILCSAQVSCTGNTGVEIEALTAVSVALLTVWDMLKAVAGREMTIADIKVVHKAGGRSGDFTRES